MPQDGEIEAGVEEFAVYGDMNWIRSLAKGDVTKLAEVLNCPWCDCYLMRRMNLHEELFQQRLAKARENK